MQLSAVAPAANPDLNSLVAQAQDAVDWSPFTPNAAAPLGLDVATGWGPTQYGCCPKTVADTPMVSGASRRVLTGWLQNGCSSRGNFGKDGAENSLTLPRDLSLAKDGSMRQAYIPELQRLRGAAPLYRAENVAFPPPSSSSPPGSYAGAKVLRAKGLQLEISARIRWSATDHKSVFGLLVLSGEGERTALGFDRERGQVFVDRRQSSANKTDADVRAGPMPKTLAEPNVVHLHAYVRIPSC